MTIKKSLIELAIGMRVKSIHQIKQHDHWIGYVVATEVYTTSGGARKFVYVRWVAPDGKLGDSDVRFEQWELEPAPLAGDGSSSA